ncbi:MAG: radical SAM/SPASM domain-containing protein [Elusimicrobiota bacterium]
MARKIARRLWPYAEWSVARALWRGRMHRKLANYLWVEFLMGRGSVRMWGGVPYWLTVDPTNFCQLHCPFCPTGANRGVRSKASMNFEHFKAFIDRVGPYVIHMDMMNWGESLLNKRLPDMIAHAKRYGIEIKLDANFNDISRDAIEKLVRSGLDILSVSIDGISQETYGKYRVGGRLEKVLENLRALVSARAELGSPTPRIVWQFLVFRHNEHEAPLVENFAKSRGADQVSLVSPFLPNEPGYLWEWSARNPRYRLYDLPGQEPPAKDVERARNSDHVKKTPSSRAFRAERFSPASLVGRRYIASLWAQCRRPADIAFAMSRLIEAVREARARRLSGGTIPFSSSAAAKPRICKWPWAGMAINPDGGVSPCCSVEDEADDFGDAFKGRWSGLWNGASYRRSRRHVRRYAAGREAVIPGSEHVCERCTAIGYADFKFPI